MTAKREFFSTNQVAQTLGISPFTIRRYIRLRMLKAVKLEGSYRVRRADLERFLKAREIETEEELAALEEEEEKEEIPAPPPPAEPAARKNARPPKRRPAAAPPPTLVPAQPKKKQAVARKKTAP